MEKIVRGRRLHDVAGFLSSIALAGMGLLGMTGIVYHCLGPDGLFSAWLGRLWSQHTGFALLVLVGLITTVLAARNQISRQRFERGGTEAPFYFFVALGTLFAGRLLIYGTL
jgi:hypothetical protein